MESLYDICYLKTVITIIFKEAYSRLRPCCCLVFFLPIWKGVPNRKMIYVFDFNTHELIKKFNSINEAMKYAKVNFYTLKNLIDNGNLHMGKIYSYKNKI